MLEVSGMTGHKVIRMIQGHYEGESQNINKYNFFRFSGSNLQKYTTLELIISYFVCGLNCGQFVFTWHKSILIHMICIYEYWICMMYKYVFFCISDYSAILTCNTQRKQLKVCWYKEYAPGTGILVQTSSRYWQVGSDPVVY